MTLWPARGRSTRRRPLPMSRAAQPPVRAEVAPIQPELLPRTALDAWAVAAILIAVGGVVAMFLYASVDRWMLAGVPGRIIYGALAAGSALTIILFVVSLVVYVLPRAIGVRRG